MEPSCNADMLVGIISKQKCIPV